jgi:HK97 gp10 family phage protein
MGITINGIAELQRKLNEISTKAPAKTGIILAQEAELLKGRAAKNTPVDTGYLRNNWKTQITSPTTAEVYNNADYAIFVEYGHRVKIHGKYTGKVVPGKKMLHTALDETEENFFDDASEILRGLF